MRIALLCLFALSFLLIPKARSQETTLETKYIIGATLSSPMGVEVDQAGNMYVADNTHLRILDPEGALLKDIIFNEIPEWGNARAITRDASGNLYIWDAHKTHIYKLDKDGKLIFKIHNTNIYSYQSRFVEGIAVAPDSSIYLTNVNENKVRKFSNDGHFLMEIKSLERDGVDQLQNTFNTPTDVAVGPDGSVYVADTGNKRIVKFSDTGQFITTYTSPGKGAKAFSSPTGVKVGNDGVLYVTDAGNSAVYTFKENGDSGLNVQLQDIPKDVNLAIGLDTFGNMYISVRKGMYVDYYNNRIIKLSPAGNKIGEFGSIDNAIHKIAATAIEPDNTGNYLYVADALTNKIQMFNRQGIKLFEFGDSGINSVFKLEVLDIATGLDGSLYVYELVERNNIYGKIKKFSAAGEFILEFEAIPSQGTAFHHTFRLTAGLDNFLYVLGNGKVMKYDTDGKLLAITTVSDLQDTTPPTLYKDLAVDKSGNQYIFSTRPGYPSSHLTLNKVKKYSSSGQLLLQFEEWTNYGAYYGSIRSINIDNNDNLYISEGTTKIYNTDGVRVGHMSVVSDRTSVSKDGNAFMAITSSTDDQLLILRKSSDNNPSYITGTIFHDADQDNKPAPNEAKFKDILVKAEPGSVFGKSDANGNYKIEIDDIGTYEVSQILPDKNGLKTSQVFPESAKNHVVTVSDRRSTVSFINFANEVTVAPYLIVSVSSDRRRRCFESVTKVNYSNSGFAPAVDAKVYLQLPIEVELLSADKPYTRQSDGTYVFEVGTLEAGKSGVITIQDKVVCGDESIRGKSVCTNVWMTPANGITPPIDTKWDGSMIITKGKCLPTGYVRLSVHNTGKKDMADYSKLRVYSNSELVYQQEYKLAAGDSLILHAPGEGKTIRLEAEQAPENPIKTMASVTVQGCIKQGGVVAFGEDFVNMFAADEEEPEVASDCQQIIDSYDPNDKLVTPIGRTEENYTPTNTALKYKIRFQNTGTDVAYRVVVVDTLSEHLDISTLQMGAVSHNYRMDVSGKGLPVLTWTFDNIMLPDSNANEPASHGYIQFSIKPKADLPEKTAVENFADIFFDFNSPVRTNVTVNRIYDMPPVIDEAKRLNPDEVIVKPVITALTPDNGKLGSEFTIAGDDFSTDPAENKVTINGVAATVTAASAKQLTVLVPEGATTGKVALLTPDGAATSAEDFTVWQRPVFSSFSPAEGIIGSSVTLTGSFFYSEHEAFSVKLGDVSCTVLSKTENSITIEVPAGATSGVFTLVTPGGEAAATQSYRVWHAPRISSFSADTVKVGDMLVLHGENFSEHKERNILQLSNLPVTVQQASSNMLQISIPMEAVTGPVRLTTPGGETYSAEELTIVPFPRITTVAPASGSVGTLVKLTGQNFSAFQTQDEVSFSGTLATVLEANTTSIKVRVPRGALTGKVTVTGIGGQAEADFKVVQLTPEHAIRVYPNPTREKFDIDLQYTDFNVLAFHVFNVTGKLIQSDKLAKGQHEKVEVNLTGHAPGLYLVVLQTDRGQVVKKVTLL